MDARRGARGALEPRKASFEWAEAQQVLEGSGQGPPRSRAKALAPSGPSGGAELDVGEAPAARGALSTHRSGRQIR